MRLHQPLATVEALEGFLADPPVAAALAARRVLPARPAIEAPLPDWLDPRLVRGLERRGITGLYSHQREAIDALREGRDVAVVTPTASGKSLCYNLPGPPGHRRGSRGAGAVPLPHQGAEPGPAGRVPRPRDARGDRARGGCL